MSEPKGRAGGVELLVPGVLHWTIHDERIDFRSDAYAVTSQDGAVLIDPLPLTDDGLAQLGQVREIVLTGGFHQRAAWSLRRRLAVPVRAPLGAAGLEETADRTFVDGERLVAGLTALQRPGPTQPHFVLLHAGSKALFSADLLMRTDDGPFAFVPDEHQDDPARTRESVRDCLELDAELLCPAHGRPAASGAIDQLRRALELDAG